MLFIWTCKQVGTLFEKKNAFSYFKPCRDDDKNLYTVKVYRRPL